MCVMGPGDGPDPPRTEKAQILEIEEHQMICRLWFLGGGPAPLKPVEIPTPRP